MAYGALGTMVPGEAFGIKWLPKDSMNFSAMVSHLDDETPCYSYKARPSDSISRIAEKMWGPGLEGLQRLLLDNQVGFRVC